ncbi:FmdE family protein [Methylomonas sp. LL1]|uniref:FmdE family protein n=1 Tax=Methylomonas sp. LL1 TaxID=2785785 RepID=UPI0018C37FF3|nr:FmdE family protein [Methylomonas sp. LL1]
MQSHERNTYPALSVLFGGAPALCEGLLIAVVEIKTGQERLYQDGIFDRTDLRALSKNSPCRVDALAFMTG